MGVEYRPYQDMSLPERKLLFDPLIEAKISKDTQAIAELLREREFSTVVVLGSAGAGKSTVVERVAPMLGAEKIMADEVFGQNPFFGPDKTDRKRWAFSSNVWFLTEKFKLIRDRYLHLAGIESQPKVIMDSGLTMGLVYAKLCLEQGLYTFEEYELFNQLSTELITQLPQPNLYLRLKMSPAQLRQRVLQRGRQFEIERYTEEYLRSLENALSEQWETLQTSGIPALEYDL